MTASAPYLSFNATFTPACMGWVPATGADGAKALIAAGGKPRKPEKTEMQLVYYVGVARGQTVLVDFGKHRKVLSHVLSGVLAHVPLHVSRYSLGYGRTVALFLISEGYTYFSVADEALGRSRGFQTLSQVRVAFLECLGGNSQSNASSVSNSFETETTCSSVGGGGGKPEAAGKEAGSRSTPEDGDIQLLRRPSIPRSRSASQLTALMSEAMESKFEEIVSKCKGRPLPRPKLETYPDAPDAYLTSKKSVYEPDLLEDETACEEGQGASSAPSSKVSARDSLLSEIADMLREVDSPRVAGRPRDDTERQSAEGEGEEEEDEHIPGMDLLMGMVGGDKWFSVGGAAAWDAPSRATSAMYSTARFHNPRGMEEGQAPLRPSSGVLRPVTIFDDAEEEAAETAAEGGEGDGARVQKTVSMMGESSQREGADGSPVPGRARQRLKLSVVDKGGPRRSAQLHGRKVPPILRGALNSVFHRTSTGTRLNVSASQSRGTDSEGLPTVAELQSPRVGSFRSGGGQEEAKGQHAAQGQTSSKAQEAVGSGRLAPLLHSLMRRGDQEGAGGAGSQSGRAWRLSSSLNRVKAGRTEVPSSQSNASTTDS